MQKIARNTISRAGTLPSQIARWWRLNLWAQLWLSTVATVLAASIAMASVAHFLIVPVLLDLPNKGPKGGLPIWPYLKDLGEAGVLSVLVGLAMYPIIRARTKRLQHLVSQVGAIKHGDFVPDSSVSGKQDELSHLDAQLQDAKLHLGQLMGRHKRFLANASHELRTPIARLRLGIEGLERDLHEEDCVEKSVQCLEAVNAAHRQETLAQMKQDVQEVHTLIEEVLLASRLDNPQLHPVFEPVDLLALAAEEASHLNVECSGDIVNINGDAVLLRRLLRNLIENAVKFAQGKEASVWIGFAPSKNGQACIVVSDGGEGIAPELRSKIFEPFIRLNPKIAGSGLGLSLVREIARLHGGEVGYEKNPAGGSKFIVNLPL